MVTGKPAPGFVQLKAYLYDPGEDPPLVNGRVLEPRPFPIGEWLRTSVQNGAIQFEAPPEWDGVKPVLIPASLLEPLPQDASMQVEWELLPRPGVQK